ncbi:DNA-3-methyladenine glycosylase II /DNA-O6-methylguanine--protein-cysteine S-methyltransferase /Transcriptional regulator Ada [Saccharomonospora azurea SZMC 14600]|uniref:DNA-3-methyladenine glycosylase 2 family protein n=1 Tax=Saccharomonospora azurea TaxID=40988 RepID=UPI0002400BA7|nr:AlkA N-terminal domain-containing protein [Saccharomonospora azurea]EHK89181.1 DNA-3-methyladenine glycosylase II /DNA-O6-methylguanine--protein-cysteine S-methyltransferase /Transcriptional regulator Ada [Saccharomonospora azurea SZMC 14600]
MTQVEALCSGLWRDTERCYRAVSSRDARFDGQFVTAVRTTRIYCRPSCPALTPKPQNVEFFPTAAAAQSRGYRACKRCLPDAVPGSPEWDVRADLAARAMRLIAEGTVEREGVSGLSRRLGYSERHLGRVLGAELGAGPLALARAHRAHSARVLIEMSDLPITDVAFASGFSSVRQFNDTIREVFAATPSELRASAVRRGHHRSQTGDTAPTTGVRLCLRLPFRPPFDASGVLEYLAVRAVPGVESANARDHEYRRTFRLPHGPAVVRVLPQPTHVECVVRLTDVRDLATAVSRVRRLWDLNADPQAVLDCLSRDPVLEPWVAKAPGIRVPGAVDGAEIVLRAMLGQQVSVPAARTATTRLAAELGEPVAIASPDDPARLFPSPATVADHAGDVLTGPRRRIAAIREVAASLASGDLDVHIGRDADELRHDLLSLPGIGPWTADYVLLRLLGRTDLLLDTDRALQRGAQVVGLDRARLSDHARRWRPWRSYAGMYLWLASTTPSPALTRKEAP